MEVWEGGAIFAAGTVAGAINAAVGSGTIITFSTLVGLGYPPLVANISNSLGLISGSVAGAWGYRKELRGWGPLLRRLAPWSLAGGVLGAVLLLVLPPGAFTAVVPVLIGLAVVLVLVQPRLAARLQARVADGADPAEGPVVAPVGAALIIGATASAAYGGYFGAAQGVLLLGVLGWLLTPDLQLANGVKNFLVALTNGIAAVVFAVAAADEVDWVVVLLLAIGATLGGFAGAAIARRLPPIVLRVFIVVVGVAAIVRLLV